MKNTITTVIALLFFAKIQAQDVQKFTLNDAIQFGISNNKALKAKELDVENNSYKKAEIDSHKYPTITGNFGINHFFNVPKQYVPANTFDPSASADTYTGLQLQLPNASTIGISANWTVYNKAIAYALKYVNAQSELTDLQIEKSKNELAYSISQLYYGIDLAVKQEESLVKIDQNISKLIQILQTNYENGTMKKSEVEKVTVRKVNSESQINELNTVIETQKQLLKMLIGLPNKTEIELVENDFASKLSPILEFETKVEQTNEYKLIGSQINMNSIERKSLLTNYYPTVQLGYNLSTNWVSPDFDKVIFSKLYYPQQFIGLNATIPIFDGKKNFYKLRQNEIKTKQLGLDSQFLAERINTETSNAVLKFNSSLKSINTNSTNVKLGENLYAQSLIEYKLGALMLNEVVNFEISLEQAHTEYFRSISNALSALLEYKKSTNTIFSK